MKVRVLRGFQNFEVGSIIDLRGSRLALLLARKMVEEYKEPEPEQKPLNRAVDLEGSAPKASAKRKK